MFQANRIKSEDEVVKGVTFERRDLLGLDLLYSRNARRVIFSCRKAIEKCAARYGLENCKPAKTPVSTLEGKEDEPTQFPCREAIGSIMWI